jgi:RNA polymerase sigma-70 factor (ECF subfamily)
MSLPPSGSSSWFAEHVQPHESLLRAWLHQRFPSLRDIDDIVQESYIRVLQARDRVELQFPKAFLFATARNLALDTLRHQQVTGEHGLVESELSSVIDDSDGIPESVAYNQELILLTEAIQSLPARCRQVFTLRKIYGMSQKEIAVRLDISERTVSAQLTIGVHKCTDYFARYRREGRGRL